MQNRSFRSVLATVLAVLLFASCFSALIPGSASYAATKPAKPKIAAQVLNNGQDVEITIKATTGAQGYKIVMKGPADTKFKKVKTLKKKGTVVRKYVVSGLSEGTYSFKVRAYTKADGKTVWGSYSKVSSVTISDPAKANDGYIHILSTKEAANIPKLTVVGDKWPCSEAELQAAWKKYYSLMVQLLGPIADDFYSQGITWIMTDETLSHRVNEQLPEQNAVEMGIPVHSTDKDQCIQGLVHETGHMWLQNNNDAIRFDHGQWIWEAVTNYVGLILTSEGIQGHILPSHADLYEYAGWDCINGVINDGDKANRSISDFSAGASIFYLDTVLSTPGTYDYWIKVNELRNKYEKAESCGFTSKELMSKILDEAAAGKTIDGITPSEWLYTRAVSNISGKSGTYLNVFGNYDDYLGHDMRIWLYGFTRKDLKETGLSGQEVIVNAYNAAGEDLAEGKFTLSENGTVDKRSLKTKTGADLNPDDIPANSAIRYTAKATINGTAYTDTNYTIVLGRDDRITAADDRMFFILTDKSENLVSAKANSITVTGATSVDTSGIANGLLIVHVKQGSDVTITTKAGTYTYSKPAGSRVIPIRVK